MDFGVRTARSTSPFAWGCLGELMVCAKPSLIGNSRKESALYWGPVLDVIKSAMPWMAKSYLSTCITTWDVSLRSSLISNHLEYVVVYDDEVDISVQLTQSNWLQSFPMDGM